MSNKLFQGLIYQMREAVDREIGIIDDKGVVIACSQLSKIGSAHKDILDELSYNYETLVIGDYTYRPIGSHARIEYIVFVEGDDDIAKSISALLSVSFSNIKTLYDEKYDKTNFIKNIILDNILPGDIYIKSKELRFDSEVNRAVILIRFSNTGDIIPYDVIQNMFPDKLHDYVINVGESDIVLVKELKSAHDTKTLETVAKSIVDTVQSEFYLKVHIGIGSTVSNVKELARSYKDAQVALEVGKVFDTEKNVINYESLGIGRLIYQLPTTLCECSFRKYSSAALWKALTVKLLPPFTRSSITTSTFPKPRESSSFTVTLSFTVLKRSRSLPVSTFANSNTLSPLRLL